MYRVLLAFEPPDGGVAEQLLQLAAGLRAHGWEAELAGPADAVIYDRAEAAGLTVHRLGWRRDYGHPREDLAGAAALRRRLRAGRYDVLHVHSAKAGGLGRLVAATLPRRRPPVVYTPHGFPWVGEFGPLRRHGGALAERLLALGCDRIVCVADFERREAARVGIAERRLRVVRNGSAPCPAGAGTDAATAALRGDGVLAAAITVLRPGKGLDLLLDATPAILAGDPAARVAIIGNGPLREALAEQARRLGLDGEPRFAMLPFAGPPARHLAATDVNILCSAWEALPMSILEAMACGVPSVATAVGGTPEAVTPDVGTLIPVNDGPALSAAILELLGDPARRAAMAQAARARHATEFAVERMVAETAAVYDELAAR